MDNGDSSKLHLNHLSKGQRRQKVEELIWRFLIHLETTRPQLVAIHSRDNDFVPFWITGADITRKYELHPGYGSLVTAILRKQMRRTNDKIPFKVESEKPVKVQFHTKPISRFYVKRMARAL